MRIAPSELYKLILLTIIMISVLALAIHGHAFRF